MTNKAGQSIWGARRSTYGRSLKLKTIKRADVFACGMSLLRGKDGLQEKTSVFLAVLLVLGLIPFASLAMTDGDKGDVVVDGVSVKVSSGVSICVSDNMKVARTGEFVNSGTMFFANQLPIDLDFYSTNSGAGKFVFAGSADCELIGNVSWGKVAVAMDGASLLLSGNLTVTDSLELSAGIIDARSARVELKNNLANSLTFNNKEENTSYILGSFTRAVSENGSFYFPVGDEAGFHPFLVQNPNGQEEIEVNYDSSVSQEWAFVIQEATFAVEDVGGWQVKSGTEFNSGLSHIDRGGSKLREGGKYRILRAQDNASYATGYQECNSLLAHDFYSLGTEKITGGIYTLANESLTVLPNFVFVSSDSNNNTLFEIPESDREKYTKIELTVYNRWGQKVYTNNNYDNGMDCSDFPQGTYFYELKLYQGTSMELVRNFIEIKRGK
ncbi:MAG: gliding motility-associated C-terminal domain-containing protein [Mangrovibacterium sp.]